MTEPAARLELEVQYAVQGAYAPTQGELRAWVLAALQGHRERVEMVVRVVGAAESRALNGRYRGKDKATNVLSFPFEVPPGVGSDHLGDLVICAPLVNREAREQGKQRSAHWAHMVVHGVLHLRGYDHEAEQDAAQMETQERRILEGMGIDDPYRTAM